MEKGLKCISGFSFSVISFLPQYLPRELKALSNQINCCVICSILGNIKDAVKLVAGGTSVCEDDLFNHVCSVGKFSIIFHLDLWEQDITDFC